MYWLVELLGWFVEAPVLVARLVRMLELEFQLVVALASVTG